MRSVIRAAVSKIVRKKKRPLQEIYPEFDIGTETYGGLNILGRHLDATFKIGSYCSIGGNVKIILAREHRTDWVTTFPFTKRWSEAVDVKGHPGTKGSVLIGSDVWIGEDATILSGSEIGDGAVIAASAVVSKTVPPYAIVAGNPAKIIKMRFTEKQIIALLRLKWWDWKRDRIAGALPFLLNNNVDAFIRTAEKHRETESPKYES